MEGLRKMRKKKSKRFFTILELMIVISIVAIAGGGIFWWLSRLVQAKQKETDTARVGSLLLSSRMMAINTKSDWELEMLETKEGWTLRLIALEEPGKEIKCGKLSPLVIRFEEEKLSKEEKSPIQKRIAIRFYSTGQVAPFGALVLPKEKIQIPAFFRQAEGNALGPMHPDELEGV